MLVLSDLMVGCDAPADDIPSALAAFAASEPSLLNSQNRTVRFTRMTFSHIPSPLPPLLSYGFSAKFLQQLNQSFLTSTV